MESRYKLEDIPEGFRIWGDGRPEIQVILYNETQLSIQHAFTTGLYEVHKMCNYIVAGLMRDWKGDETKKYNVFVSNWARKQCGKAIAKRVTAKWRELVGKANPTIAAVQKAVFALSAKSNSTVLDPNFYKQADIGYLQDVIKYRAAAATTFPEVFPQDYSDKAWMQLYTDSKKGMYDHLLRTLIDFPGGIPVYYMAQLAKVRLVRPTHSRRELLFLLGCVDHYGWRLHTTKKTQNIIKNATSKEITRVAKTMDPEINLRKFKEVFRVSNFIMSERRVQGKNLTELADKIQLVNKTNDVPF